ncbi:MAG: tetratricopeptide repeat protein [Candidatus Zixiibacteriota bacterium]
MNIVIIVGIILASVGLIIFLSALVFSRRIKLKKRKIVPAYVSIPEKKEKILRGCTYAGLIVAFFGVVIALWTDLHLGRIENENRKHLAETNKRLDSLQVQSHAILTFLDGLLGSKNPDLKGLSEKGYSLYEGEEYFDAIDTFKACLKLETEPSEREALFILIGNAFHALKRFEEAEDSYQEALRIGKTIDDEEGEAAALGNIGLIYQARGDLDQALKYLEEALEIHGKIIFREGEASDLGNIGLIYQAKGDLDQALKYYSSAWQINMQIGRKEGEASQTGNIGNVWYLKGQLDMALWYYQRALKFYRQTGRQEGAAIQLNNIGLVYETKGDLDSAWQSYNEAIKIFQEIGMPEQIGKLKGNIERVSQQMKNKK